MNNYDNDVSFEDLIKSGNQAQLEKLKSNRHKHGIGHLSFGFLLNKISVQVFKLRSETCTERDLYNSKAFHIKKDLRFRVIRGIAANIANYCYMLILQCDQELNEKNHE